MAQRRKRLLGARAVCYYTDGQLATQSQAGLKLSYGLDPARRTTSITTSGTQSSQIIEHYAGEGDSPSWSSELDGKWTRHIPGIGTAMAAIQTEGAAPVLQLSDLQGNIVATAEDNEAASKLLSTSNSTEYGVPTSNKPARYSWLGSLQLSTELPSGVVAMGARSYVPQLGRFLQPDPQPGGSANAYAYTHGNPVNETDPSGGWSLNETSGGNASVGEGEGEMLAGGVGDAPGSIAPPPVNTQIEAEFWADPPWDQITAGSEELEEYEEPGESAPAVLGVSSQARSGGHRGKGGKDPVATAAAIQGPRRAAACVMIAAALTCNVSDEKYETPGKPQKDVPVEKQGQGQGHENPEQPDGGGGGGPSGSPPVGGGIETGPETRD